MNQLLKQHYKVVKAEQDEEYTGTPNIWYECLYEDCPDKSNNRMTHLYDPELEEFLQSGIAPLNESGEKMNGNEIIEAFYTHHWKALHDKVIE